MNDRRRRFLLYAAIGLIFGVIDWFYLDWLARAPWDNLGESVWAIAIIIGLNYGIWLVPIIPVCVYEAGAAEKIRMPMLAGMLVWACAIFSYYAWYAVLLSTGRLIHLEHLNIFGEKYAAFWPEYWQMFRRIILSQFVEWIIIALIGGAVTGALAFWFMRRVLRRGTLVGAGGWAVAKPMGDAKRRRGRRLEQMGDAGWSEGDGRLTRPM